MTSYWSRDITHCASAFDLTANAKRFVISSLKKLEALKTENRKDFEQFWSMFTASVTKFHETTLKKKIIQTRHVYELKAHRFRLGKKSN